MEERGAIALYLVFAGLAVAGTYWALAGHKGRAAGIWGALAAAVFFAALFWGLQLLLRSAGIP